MTFGGKGWAKTVGNLGVAEARKLVDMSLDAGVNLIDTADVYSQGVSEEIVGEIIGKRREGRAACNQGPLPDGRRAKRCRIVAPSSGARLRGEPEAG